MPVSRRWLLSLSTALPLILFAPVRADEGDATMDAAEPTEVAPAAAEPAATPAEPAPEVSQEKPPAKTAPASAAETEAEAPPAQATARDTATGPGALWSDFNHYVRIARPDLALASGTALLKAVDDQQLLDVVEAGDYKDYEKTLTIASKIETLRELSDQIAGKIQAARVGRARDPKRIVADISRLAEGDRANANAVARLKAAGQYAAPALLQALLDEQQAKLRPYVISAMVSLGRSVVVPLAVALPSLDPVAQGQIAQVLAEIGYPRAIPYLKQVSENPKTDPGAKRTIDAAYHQLARAAGVPETVSAAELFLTLGQNHYSAGSRGDKGASDAGEGKGLVWTYDNLAGLVPIPVPNEIYHDVLAMRAAKTALSLNPRMDPALSLWLASNLRRENRLPAKSVDPSYGQDMRPPAFYLEMAGPLRQHDVLARALEDNDPTLALDAIDALRKTAGTDALINREGTVQPLLRALSYPDRRVRFEAAFTMANARPKSEFPGSHRVVPVLAEAMRQSDAKSALVLSGDRDTANKLVAGLKEAGYQAYGGTTLTELVDPINAGPGVDLVIVDEDIAGVEAVRRDLAQNYKLAAAPMVAIVSAGDQIELNRRYDRDHTIRTVVRSPDNAGDLKAAVESAAKMSAGAPMSPEESQKYALTSLSALGEIAQNGSPVFNAADAQSSLIAALSDKRAPVAIAAAGVLARMESPEAQQAIAEAALDASRPEETRIALLGSLAESATQIGNHLGEVALSKLLDLVKTSRGDVAIAAARAHGALTLPTSDLVPLIVKG